MKENSYKYIPIDVYKRELYVWVGKDLNVLKEWVKTEFTQDDEVDFLNYIISFQELTTAAASFFYNNKNGTGIIWLPEFPNDINDAKSLACIAHEVLHATFHVLNFCRVEYSYDGNNEAFTCLHEHIFRNVLEDKFYTEFKTEET